MIASTPPPAPVDHVAVRYVAPRKYRFTVTLTCSHAELDPALDLYVKRPVLRQPFVVADDNRVVPRCGSFTVTIKFPVRGRWFFGYVDSTVPGNPDGAYEDSVRRWNGLSYVDVR